MTEPGFLSRLWSWITGFLRPIDECGVLASTGDVYCALPDGHDGLHGFEPEPKS